MSQPMHPALVHLPIGLWSMASILDGAILMGFSTPFIIKSAGYLILMGLVFSGPTMLAGAWDYYKLISNNNLTATCSEKVLIHAGIMLTATCLYLLALILRFESSIIQTPSLFAIICSGCGFATLLVGGWFGGELVYNNSVNVKIES